jgi:hypothetical protein
LRRGGYHVLRPARAGARTRRHPPHPPSAGEDRRAVGEFLPHPPEVSRRPSWHPARPLVRDLTAATLHLHATVGCAEMAPHRPGRTPPAGGFAVMSARLRTRSASRAGVGCCPVGGGCRRSSIPRMRSIEPGRRSGRAPDRWRGCLSTGSRRQENDDRETENKCDHAGAHHVEGRAARADQDRISRNDDRPDDDESNDRCGQAAVCVGKPGPARRQDVIEAPDGILIAGRGRGGRGLHPLEGQVEVVRSRSRSSNAAWSRDGYRLHRRSGRSWACCW